MIELGSAACLCASASSVRRTGLKTFVEVEQDGELAAEIFRDGNELRIAMVGQDGERHWEAPIADRRSALQRAEAELLPVES